MGLHKKLTEKQEAVACERERGYKRSSKISIRAALKPDDECVFPHMIIGDIPRKFDAEAKIFEDIHSRIKGKNVRGNLYLYTQKIPCPSCQNVIEEFHAAHPNINLKVFYGEGIKVYDSGNELDKWMNIDRSWARTE